ncbi:OLC1v1030184C2 [Oldenlandia corymbosa var. corymbosa]|uniref:protein-serine/threonine phosphatase n=1 Tax=Oldenlandia corymbosa var. corymbosa TaxID=529605 RepID=A0AAV1CHG2_OLDCO|nr:OLC1v1030184C2 [Oldenlandia corymbosa var. corymbosa]
MDADKVVVIDNGGGNSNNGISGGNDSLPPKPLGGVYRQSLSTGQTPTAASCKKSLARHPSLVKTKPLDIPVERLNINDCETVFSPSLRSGAWADIGGRSAMEDVFVCADDFVNHYGLKSSVEGPSAFYGVFDGHGGKHAADFAGHHLPRFIAEDEGFPEEIERAISSAFLQTDTAFAEACTLDNDLASGTTALAALVIGRSLVVANAGDCRAVLCRRGKAIEMSRDHKPCCFTEKKRIEASGGYVFDGYLNGQLNVARALGDWHMEGLKHGDGGPLSAEPELMSTRLTEEDEFLIIGCDGIWDVFMSQNAVDFARRKLQEHNDPEMCCKDLVEEALKRRSGDNLSVVVVCFQPQPPPNLIVPRGRVHRSISAEGLKELQGFLDRLAE